MKKIVIWALTIILIFNCSGCGAIDKYVRKKAAKLTSNTIESCMQMAQDIAEISMIIGSSIESCIAEDNCVNITYANRMTVHYYIYMTSKCEYDAQLSVSGDEKILGDIWEDIVDFFVMPDDLHNPETKKIISEGKNLTKETGHSEFQCSIEDNDWEIEINFDGNELFVRCYTCL